MSRPTDYFKYKNGSLSVENVSLKALAKKYGTPLYVYSAAGLLTPLKALQKGLKPLDHMICFAVKANSNLSILRLLANAGAGMDLVSEGELLRAIHAGVSPKKIVFSGVGKTAEEMETALKKGIYSFNVESPAELNVLETVAARLRKKASVALRFNPNVDARTHPHISTGLRKNKFGIQKADIISILKNASNYPHISFKGISIHIGSQLTSLSPLNDAFALTVKLIRQANRILPEPLEFADLGGGLGITYRSEDPPSAREYCELILEHFGSGSGLEYPMRILIEPGRFIAGNAGVLLTKVLYRKQNARKGFLIIDAAMNDLMRPSLYGGYHDILPLDVQHGRGKKTKVDIVGPVCESTDCFGSNRAISSKVDSGDYLAVMSAGAYGFTMASNYNSRPRPAEILVQNGKARLIRKRESSLDLFRAERF